MQAGLKKTNTLRSATMAFVAGCSFIFAITAVIGVSAARAQSTGGVNAAGATSPTKTKLANVTSHDAFGPDAQAHKPAARTSPQQPAGPKKKAQQAAGPRGPVRHYFVEFRARLAESYGHAYLTYGRVDGNGTIIQSQVAGLHPFGESVLPWLIGHLIPVPSETGASDGDMEEMYISARYRVLLSEADYIKTVAFIKQQQANNPLWHASLNNCIGFLKDVAHFMGLQTPLSTLIYPEVFVNRLREMNENPDHIATTLIPRVQWGVQ